MRRETLRNETDHTFKLFFHLCDSNRFVCVPPILFFHSFLLCPFLKIKSKNSLPRQEDSFALLFVGGAREDDLIKGRKFDGHENGIL